MSVTLYTIAHLKKHTSKLHEIFLNVLILARLSSDDNAIRCVLRFVDGVTFAHNRPDKLGDANRAYKLMPTQSASPGAEPGAKSDVYDFLVFQFLHQITSTQDTSFRFYSE